mmetsp:Transcript_18625/g.50509  ORF Transcript_18625/g.50509 Transcript_18625/m.50509 type:complete len:381 (-) Transcript_18625:108-1250(-)
MVNGADVLSPTGLPKSLPGDAPFGAFGRQLFVCASGRHERGALADEGAGCPQAGRNFPQADSLPVTQAGSPTLMDLTEGPYLLIATHLDAAALCQADTACRSLRELNRAHGGPWCSLGSRSFYGIELDGDSVFEPMEGRGVNAAPHMSRKQARVDWKGRYARFLAEVLMFRSPFGCADITEVQQPDEIAYSQCRVRTDLLAEMPTSSVYVEIDVVSNPDNVSLAIVDFEDGGCSSVTFSPDTGAVIRERKVCESPRKVQGSYIQPLSTITPGQGFEGSLGMYLKGGHIAFYRRHVVAGENDEEPELGPWESTGFVTDLTWAEGKRLTPCLAFRNEGQYRVSAVCVGSQPPLLPEKNAAAYQEASWSSLNWDADQDFEEDM